MKRIDIRTDAGNARLTDAQRQRELHLLDVFAPVPVGDGPTEADYLRRKADQAQANANAAALAAWPEPRR